MEVGWRWGGGGVEVKVGWVGGVGCASRGGSPIPGGAIPGGACLAGPAWRGLPSGACWMGLLDGPVGWACWMLG